MLHPLIESPIIRKEPFLWLNDGWQSVNEIPLDPLLTLRHVYDAELRLKQFATLLLKLFPELTPSSGIIESALYPADHLQRAMMDRRHQTGRWLIKGDHALPVAGSIKARGGIYEVLLHAENLALRYGLIKPMDDRLILSSPQARALFSRHRVAVGSTGNLGLSIGVMAAALGFQANVHMSCNAKEWKKALLRARGVDVVEYEGDYGVAVSAGQERAREDPDVYFVDDENSKHLFLGYSVAALRLQQQLVAQGIKVDAQHPLFVYLPCGVGGAPGGITFGLRHLLGDHVYCLFAEPTASPCMLIRLASADDGPISVRDFGLDNYTEADGLAVGRASEFVAPLMRPLVSGLFTVPDNDLFEDLYLLKMSEGIRIEPSAAAGFRGPRWLLESETGQQYLTNRGLAAKMGDATHILWTTGGSFVPDEEYRDYLHRGQIVRTARTSLQTQTGA